MNYSVGSLLPSKNGLQKQVVLFVTSQHFDPASAIGFFSLRKYAYFVSRFTREKIKRKPTSTTKNKAIFKNGITNGATDSGNI